MAGVHGAAGIVKAPSHGRMPQMQRQAPGKGTELGQLWNRAFRALLQVISEAKKKNNVRLKCY